MKRIWSKIVTAFRDTSKSSRVTIIFLVLIIGIILTVAGTTGKTEGDPTARNTLLFTFGLTFTATALISFVMLGAGLLDLEENAKELARVIGEQLDMPCAQRFQLVSNASRLGLANVFKNREEALSKENFTRFIEKEQDEIFVVGSSLKGLLQDRHYTHVKDLLSNKAHDNVELTFMLTHPLFADFRAAQEKQKAKCIGTEILESLKILKEFVNPNRRVNVLLYRGTPTMFGIRTRGSMLINPYPYGRQAFLSPCFEFEPDSPIYSSYEQTHFQTQLAGKVEEFDTSLIDKLEKLLDDFSVKTKEYEALYPMEKIDEQTST